MKILKKKDGFTLIEILIVLFIIAMLSTLAINGYTQYRRIALLDFSVDSFISQFYELRDNTVHGDYGGSDFEGISEAIENIGDPEWEYDPEAGDGGEVKCYGLYFVNDGEVNSIKKLELPYSYKKEFDSGDWVSAGCDYEGIVSGEFSDVSLDDQISVLGIYLDDTLFSNFAVSFVFVPPNGEIEVKDVRGKSVDAEEIRIEIKYGESLEGKYKRNIFVDLKSGQIYVTKDENVE